MAQLFRMWSGQSGMEVKDLQGDIAGQLPQQPVEPVPKGQPYNVFTEIQVLSQHTDIVRLLLKIDDKRCVSAADDATAVIWDVQIAKKLFVLSSHTRPISCMMLLKPEHGSHEDAYLLTGASDKHICVWNIENGDLVQTIKEHKSSVKCLVSMPNIGLFISGGYQLCAWDRQGHLLHTYERPLTEADVHILLPIRNDRIVAAVEKQLTVYSLVTVPSGSKGAEESKEIVMIKKLPPHREAIRSLVSVSDGSFASGSIDGTIILWTTQTLNPSRYFNSIKEYEGRSHRYPFSVQHMTTLDDRYIFATIGSGFIVVDCWNGHLLAEKKNAHYSKIVFIQFVYDGHYLATCSEDGAIRLWGQLPVECTAKGTENEVKELPSPVERFLGMSKEQIKSNTGSKPPVEPVLLGECLGHSGTVQMIADYGMDGFVSCGVDGLLIIWKDGVLQRINRNGIVKKIVSQY